MTNLRQVLDLIEFLDRYRSGMIADPQLAEELLGKCEKFMKPRHPPLSRKELIQMIQKTRRALLEESSVDKLRNIYRLGRVLSTFGIFATVLPLLVFMLFPPTEHYDLILGIIILGIVMINIGYPLMIYVRRRYHKILESVYAREHVNERIKKYINYLTSFVADLLEKKRISGEELTMTLLNPDYDHIKIVGKKGRFFVAIPCYE